ncbi:MAG: histidinol-phosphate transaminase [candidate division WOR-3 bacterium]|nr:MAG: histidinol-phosphate transaminase [candidate division WOR-3 bacterium]
MIELRNFVKNIKPYKPGKPIEEVIKELGLTGEIIKLASNENPLGASPLAIKAMSEKIDDSHLYPDDNCFYLKHRLSEKFGIPTANTIVGSGSVELIELIFKAYVNPGDEVIMSEPSFIMYKIACQIFGGERVAVPLVGHAHDIDAMAQKINSKTKIVILDNPINPTGTIVAKKKMDHFVDAVPPDVILVLDEAYHEYIEDATYPNGLDYLKKHSNIMVLHTFSKIYGLAGLRVGYGFGSEEIVGAMMKVRLPFNVNRIGQIAAGAALGDEDFVKHSRNNNEAGKEFLYNELRSLGLKYTPTFGNFILVDFKRDAKDIFEAAQRKGVITRTVYEYGLPTSLRITIGSPSQNKQLINTLQEFLR